LVETEVSGVRHSGGRCVCGAGDGEKENDRWALSMEQNGKFKFYFLVSRGYKQERYSDISEKQ